MVTGPLERPSLQQFRQQRDNLPFGPHRNNELAAMSFDPPYPFRQLREDLSRMLMLFDNVKAAEPGRRQSFCPAVLPHEGMLPDELLSFRFLSSLLSWFAGRGAPGPRRLLTFP